MYVGVVFLRESITRAITWIGGLISPKLSPKEHVSNVWTLITPIMMIQNNSIEMQSLRDYLTTNIDHSVFRYHTFKYFSALSVSMKMITRKPINSRKTAKHNILSLHLVYTVFSETIRLIAIWAQYWWKICPSRPGPTYFPLPDTDSPAAWFLSAKSDT